MRGNPQVAQQALDEVVHRIEHSFDALNQLPGKAGHALTSNEWLMSMRSRISIPGGTCEFDLPAYYAWQHRDAAARRADLNQWVSTMMPLAQALQVLLQLLRDSGVRQKVVAPGGQFQQGLRPGKTYQLLRVRLDPALQLVPEISGHRLMVSVRLMRAEADGRLRPSNEDASFELVAVRLSMSSSAAGPAGAVSHVRAAAPRSRPQIAGGRSAASVAGASTWAPGPANAFAWPPIRNPADGDGAGPASQRAAPTRGLKPRASYL